MDRFRQHLKVHRDNGELLCPIFCRQSGCKSCFASLSNFLRHVVENWSLDIMHIVLEGIIPVELGCILHGLCVVDKCISLQLINQEFCLLWGKMRNEKSNKPAEISKLLEPTHSIVPSMKAVQYWALLKYLPLTVGKHVSYHNKHWKFLLHLAHLVDLIFSPRFTDGMVVYLQQVIFDHLSFFSELYCDENVRMRPKHHFLVHCRQLC